LIHDCVTTAPIAGAANEQSAPTAGMAVEMAMPSIPVRWHRATIENVTTHLPAGSSAATGRGAPSPKLLVTLFNEERHRDADEGAEAAECAE
jgi:hypothetical protein